MTDPDVEVFRQPLPQCGITVGDDVWIGSHVVVLDGVTDRQPGGGRRRSGRHQGRPGRGRRRRQSRPGAALARARRRPGAGRRRRTAARRPLAGFGGTGPGTGRDVLDRAGPACPSSAVPSTARAPVRRCAPSATPSRSPTCCSADRPRPSCPPTSRSTGCGAGRTRATGLVGDLGARRAGRDPAATGLRRATRLPRALRRLRAGPPRQRVPPSDPPWSPTPSAGEIARRARGAAVDRSGLGRRALGRRVGTALLWNLRPRRRRAPGALPRRCSAGCCRAPTPAPGCGGRRPRRTGCCRSSTASTGRPAARSPSSGCRSRTRSGWSTRCWRTPRDTQFFRPARQNACNVLDVAHPLWLCPGRTGYRAEEVTALARAAARDALATGSTGRLRLPAPHPTHAGLPATDPGLQGTEMWLAIIWLLADLAGLSELSATSPAACTGRARLPEWPRRPGRTAGGPRG